MNDMIEYIAGIIIVIILLGTGYKYYMQTSSFTDGYVQDLSNLLTRQRDTAKTTTSRRRIQLNAMQANKNNANKIGNTTDLQAKIAAGDALVSKLTNQIQTLKNARASLITAKEQQKNNKTKRISMGNNKNYTKIDIARQDALIINADNTITKLDNALTVVINGLLSTQEDIKSQVKYLSIL